VVLGQAVQAVLPSSQSCLRLLFGDGLKMKHICDIVVQ